MHQNIQSIRNKLLDIQIFLDDLSNDVQVICLSEHWLKNLESETIILENYSLASCFCRKVASHGGTCIFVKKDTKFTQPINIPDFSIEKCFEYSYTFINNYNLLVIVVYRSPSSNFDTFMSQIENLLLHISIFYKNILICGDFNVDFMKDSEHKLSFSNLMTSFGLNHLVNIPTRSTSTCASCLDNVFTKNQETSVNVVFSGLSDHSAQIATMNTSSKNTFENGFCYKRNYSIVNQNKFIQYLNGENWGSFLENKSDINTKFNEFVQILDFHFENAFPLKCVRIKKRPSNSWITKGIRVSCRHKRVLIKFVSLNPNPVLKNFVSKYCSILKKVIFNSKKAILKSTIESSGNRTKNVWKVIKKETKVGDLLNDNIQVECTITNTIVSNPYNITDMFNEHFLNVGCNNQPPDLHTVDDLLQNSKKSNNKSIFVCPFDESEVYTAIISLKNKFSSGCDNIPPAILRKCAFILATPLCSLFNQSILDGVFPDCLKTAKIIPLYKNKGGKLNMSNYRPISILPGISKIFEKLVAKRVINFFEKNNLFSDSQHGFRKGRSTTSALHDLLSRMLEEIDNCRYSCVISTDLTKAFDTVDHIILLFKLYHYGIRGNIHNWFHSYLSNRRQYVEIPFTDSSKNKIHVKSSESFIKTGVPQGSVLGPLLFIIYINDLAANIFSKYSVIFADDAYFTLSATSDIILEQEISLILKIVEHWCITNNLHLNTLKTQLLIHAHRSHINTNYPINPSKAIKCLGVTFDDKLNWKIHINNLQQKLSKLCFLLSSLKKISDISVCLIAYHAYFHSIMRYGIMLWGTCTDGQTIFKIQKRSIRIIAGVSKFVSCKPLFKNYRVLTFSCTYILESLVFVHGHKNKFQFYNSGIATRQTNKTIILPRHNSTLFEKGPFYMGAKLYNHLPDEWKCLNGNHFKTKMQRLLLDNPLYNIDDFFGLDLTI